MHKVKKLCKAGAENERNSTFIMCNHAGIKMRLKEGDKISELKLPSTKGDLFDIKEVYGKKILLTFYRFASCPFCNLRIYEINQRFEELDDNLCVIAIFDAPLDFLTSKMLKHNSQFIFLADENFMYYKKYGVEQSVWKFLIGITTKVLRFCRALSKGFIPITMRGSLTTIPVDVLINTDGTIEKAYYGENTADHLSFEEIKDFTFK